MNDSVASMNERLGSQSFSNVTIPFLWGERAILEDADGALSIIRFGAAGLFAEVVRSKPAPGVDFVPIDEGFIVGSAAKQLYRFEQDGPATKITAISLDLPAVEVAPSYLKIGGAVLSGNHVSGFEVGILVQSGGSLTIGARLPDNIRQALLRSREKAQQSA
jgi:hypothetical protein